MQISKENYLNDFSLYGHLRPVDLPSPAIQLVSKTEINELLIFGDFFSITSKKV